MVKSDLGEGAVAWAPGAEAGWAQAPAFLVTDPGHAWFHFPFSPASLAMHLKSFFSFQVKNPRGLLL